MAEIKIEKKSPIWPWILAILVVLGIIIYFVYANKENDDVNDDYNDDVTNERMMDSTDRSDRAITPYNEDRSYSSTPYDQYLAYEGSIKDSTRIAKDSSYTKKAYYNLTKAVVKKADENNLEDSKALTDLRNFSMLITRISSASSNAEAKNFKTASDKVTEVLEGIQTKSYPNLKSQVDDLKQVTSKMDGTMSMNKQQDNITSFLQKSRDVLKAMNQ